MKITCDPEADAIYILVHDVVAAYSLDVEEGVTVDVDDEGHLIGTEILDASKRMTAEELRSLSFENLLYSPEPADEFTAIAKRSPASRRRSIVPR
jgi:uncharacterized protein YuzE